MKTLNRILAALAVAALLTGLTSLVATSTAQADSGKQDTSTVHKGNRAKGFRAPTSRTYLKATCKRDDNVWDVKIFWQVRGGRYANLGDPAGRIKYNDRVYRGGKRIVTSTIRFYDWPGTAEGGEETTTEVPYQQMIAPIGKERNTSRWINLDGWKTVNLSCS